MCKEVRDFPIPGGGQTGELRTMGVLIDKTPKHLISKVMLEEKVFGTWYHQRTVLLGDGKGCWASVGKGLLFTFIRSSRTCTLTN